MRLGLLLNFAHFLNFSIILYFALFNNGNLLGCCNRLFNLGRFCLYFLDCWLGDFSFLLFNLN